MINIQEMTDAELAELKRAQEVRDSEAVLVAKFVASGKPVPAAVLDKFRRYDAELHRLLGLAVL